MTLSISGQLMKLPPVPDDKTAAAMFTAHRLNDILTELAHAVERMSVMRRTGGELRHYHGMHFLNHMTEVLDQAALLKDNMLRNYPAEAEQWRAIVKVMNLAVSVNPAAKAASFAHLLQTVMYDAAHAEQHAHAMLADQTDREWTFDADHAAKHMHGAREHALKLASHIRDNYPAEWRWLHELVDAEELSNISLQVIDLGKFQDAWLSEMRDARGRWTRGSGGQPSPIKGGSEHYQVPPHERLINPRSPYPDPSDHPFFKAHPMRAVNVLHAYSAATDGQKAQGMRWYADAGLVAGLIAHGDQHKGAGLLSAYSPQTSWPVNMFNAARSVELGRPLGPGEGATVMQSHANAAQKIMDGQSFEQALPAPKTNAFARLIERKGEDDPKDPFGEVVIDRHALSVAAGERLSDKEPTPIGDDRYYQVVADEYRKAAVEASRREGKTITPSQMQAITWLVQQSANEAQDAATKQSGAAKGRVTRTANAWKNWITYAKQHNIGTTSGTTALSMLYDEEEYTELGWESQLRDPRGRWTTSGGLLAGHVAPEGFSLDPRSGRSPTSGFMVSLPGHTHQYPDSVMKDPHQLAAAIDHTLMSEKEIFKGSDVYLGGWVSDGKLWLDPSENVTDRDHAVKLGRDRNQVAIWDVQGGQEIDTGGSGGHVTEHAAAYAAYVFEDPGQLHGAAGGGTQGGVAQPGAGIAAQAAWVDLGAG